MRYSIALTALALSGAVDVAFASRCKPSPPVLSTAPTAQTTPTTLATLATPTTLVTPTTPTDETPGVPTPSQSEGTRVIKNEVSNGNFAERDADGGIPSFTVDGEASIVAGPGYKGDGSTESGCAELKASGEGSNNAVVRRDLGPSVGISQSIYNLDVRTPYTVRFFYAVVTAPTLSICSMDAYLGSNKFFTTYIFSSGQSLQWGTVLQAVSTSAVTAPLGISVTCTSGGVAMVYVDSIFMSNQVTPENIDDFELDFGNSGDGAATSTGLSDDGQATDVGSTALPETSINPTGAQESGLTGTNEPSSVGTPQPDSTGTGHSGSAATGGIGHTPTVKPGGSATTAAGSKNTENPTGASTPGASIPGASTPAAFTSGAFTSGADSTPTASTASNAASTTPESTAVSKRCANLAGQPLSGRGCGMRPVSGASAYKTFPTSTIQKEQCAALCLLDENCQSFEWTYQEDNCANSCRLVASPLSDQSSNLGNDIWAYDRSCINEIPCPVDPADSICFNAIGDTPAKSCQRRTGSLRSCATPFRTATVQECGAHDQCMSVCAMYSDCKSFATTSGSSNNCFLYSGTAAQIVESGGDTLFTDMSCYACGANMGFSKYALLLNDVNPIPDMTCEAPTTSAVDVVATTDNGSHETNTPTQVSGLAGTNTPTYAESSVGTPGPSQATYSVGTQEPAGTTTAAQSSSTGTKTCPKGVSPPGYCVAVSPTPTAQASLPGVTQDWSDGEAPPSVPDTCWAYGVKKNGYWGRTRSGNERQNTIEDCALLCSQEANCEAFALNTYDDLDGPTCALSINKLAIDGIDLNKQWSLMWNDMGCFQCEECDAESGTETQEPTTSSPMPFTYSTPESTSANTGAPTYTPSASPEPASTDLSSGPVSSGLAAPSTPKPSTYIATPSWTTPGLSATTPAATCSFKDGPVCTARQNPSGDLVCGHTGYFPWYYDQAPLDIFPHQDSEEQCAAICAAHPYCVASGWSEALGRCAIGYHELKYITWQQYGTTLVTWSDKACWSCPTCTDGWPEEGGDDTTTTTTTTTTTPNHPEFTTAVRRR